MSRTLYPILTQPVLPPNLQPETVMESKWHQPWSEPVRFKQDKRATIALMSSGMFSPVIVPQIVPGNSYVPWFTPWQDPVQTIFKRSIDGRNIAARAAGPFEPPYNSENQPGRIMPWFTPWQDPVQTIYKQAVDRRNVAARAAGPFEGIYASQLEPGRYMPWFNPFSEPVRFPKRLTTGANQFFAGPVAPPAAPTILMSQWFHPLSEPKRFPKRLQAALNPAFFYAYESVQLVTPLMWFQEFSRPVWHKPRLEVSLQWDPKFTRYVPPNPPVGTDLPLYTPPIPVNKQGGYYPANYWRGRLSGRRNNGQGSAGS